MTGVAVGLGSAARSTSSTSKGKSSKIGIFRAGKMYYCQMYYCHPFIIADGPLVDLVGLQTC